MVTYMISDGHHIDVPRPVHPRNLNRTVMNVCIFPKDVVRIVLHTSYQLVMGNRCVFTFVSTVQSFISVAVEPERDRAAHPLVGMDARQVAFHSRFRLEGVPANVTPNLVRVRVVHGSCSGPSAGHTPCRFQTMVLAVGTAYRALTGRISFTVESEILRKSLPWGDSGRRGSFQDRIAPNGLGGGGLHTSITAMLGNGGALSHAGLRVQADRSPTGRGPRRGFPRAARARRLSRFGPDECKMGSSAAMTGHTSASGGSMATTSKREATRS